MLKIINPHGTGVMRTEYRECYPKREDLSQMERTGYKFYLDGKRVKTKDLIMNEKKEF